jgi:error-prone DNA polymerase
MSEVAVSDYAELHCISNFSFLRGASHPEELVTQAHQLGYSALALTDECSLAGAVRAHLAARDTGLPLILGSEFRLADGLHLVLLATDRSSYGNLSALISLGRRQAPKGAYRLQRDDLSLYAQDCLLLWVNAERCTPSFIQNTAAWIREHFQNRAWIGVHRELDGLDRQRLHTLKRIGQQSSLPLIACGNIHMHTRSRRHLQDTLTAIRLGVNIRDAGFALHANGERYLYSRTRLNRLYPHSLLNETLNVARMCHFSLDELRYEYPEELTPNNLSPGAYLRQLTEQGSPTDRT